MQRGRFVRLVAIFGALALASCTAGEIDSADGGLPANDQPEHDAGLAELAREHEALFSGENVVDTQGSALREAGADTADSLDAVLVAKLERRMQLLSHIVGTEQYTYDSLAGFLDDPRLEALRTNRAFRALIEQRIEGIGVSHPIHTDRIADDGSWQGETGCAIETGDGQFLTVVGSLSPGSSVCPVPYTRVDVRGVAIANQALLERAVPYRDGSVATSAAAVGAAAIDPAAPPTAGALSIVLAVEHNDSYVATVQAAADDLSARVAQYSYGKVTPSIRVVGVPTANVPSCDADLSSRFRDVVTYLDKTMDFVDRTPVMLVTACQRTGYSGVFFGRPTITTDKGALRMPSIEVVRVATASSLSGTMMHELGHAYGLPHANARACPDSDFMSGPACGDAVAYYDLWTDMGASSIGGHFVAAHKHFLGWLEPAQVPIITRSQRIAIARMDIVSPAVHALRLPIRTLGPKFTGKADYFVEYRRSTNGTGMQVRMSNPTELYALSYKPSGGGYVAGSFIGTRPPSIFKGTFGVGDPFTDPSNGIKVTPVQMNDTTLTVDVEITGSATPTCGDKQCNGSETCSTCASDCGACPATCGDGQCNGSETCTSCSRDCGACPVAVRCYSSTLACYVPKGAYVQVSYANCGAQRGWYRCDETGGGRWTYTSCGAPPSSALQYKFGVRPGKDSANMCK